MSWRFDNFDRKKNNLLILNNYYHLECLSTTFFESMNCVQNLTMFDQNPSNHVKELPKLPKLEIFKNRVYDMNYWVPMYSDLYPKSNNWSKNITIEYNYHRPHDSPGDKTPRQMMEET